MSTIFFGDSAAATAAAVRSKGIRLKMILMLFFIYNLVSADLRQAKEWGQRNSSESSNMNSIPLPPFLCLISFPQPGIIKQQTVLFAIEGFEEFSQQSDH